MCKGIKPFATAPAALPTFAAIRFASSDLILIKVPIEPLWFKHERCTHDDLDNQIRNRRSRSRG
jgi:hypothetical protein